MMNRYKDFWQVTQDGLVYSAHALKLDPDRRQADTSDGRLHDAGGVPGRQARASATEVDGLHLAVPVERRAEDAAGGDDKARASRTCWTRSSAWTRSRCSSQTRRVYELASTHLQDA